MKGSLILSETIRQYRKMLNLTQEEFAAEIGVEPQHISAVERGVKGISIDKLMEIRQKFHISMDELLPVDKLDDSVKEKWIKEISDYLRGMDAIQVGVLKRIIEAMRN
jgi:transcriptional regulator with XRE-family HTH domain